ncbi:MAG: hypothetical protein A3E87_07750 [Gammaproteobacteria bacterium RIFCSPHIGHO2_12_FULL_35_23]|nr:MAG: hypothetical protein A3E87_07750 [Gammaproteobacteria bacterium RIFCSPHIGHO2_12_FULL_35_23]
MQEKSKPNKIDWEKHIEECERSSESQKQYCKKQGLNYSTFIYWCTRRKPKLEGVTSVQFGEVKIKPLVVVAQT